MKLHILSRNPFITAFAIMAIFLTQYGPLHCQTSMGSYGGVFLKSTKIHNLYNPSIGGMGAVVFNHRIGIGAYGNGLLGSIDFNGYDLEGSSEINLNLKLGYGGLYAEYFFYDTEYLRLSMPVKIGYGAVGIYKEENDDKVEKSRLLALEPELHLDIRLGNHLALSFQSSYRIGYVKELVNVSNETISGLNFGIGLKMISR